MADPKPPLPPLPFDPVSPQGVPQAPPSGQFHQPPPPASKGPTPSFIDSLERAQHKRWADRIKTASVIIGALTAGGGVVYGILEQRVNVAIEVRVEPVEKRVDSMEERVTKTEGKLKQVDEITIKKAEFAKLRKELFELYRFKAGEKAAELETNRALKARARRIAYREFERYVDHGESLDDAYRKASGEPSLP